MCCIIASIISNYNNRCLYDQPVFVRSRPCVLSIAMLHCIAGSEVCFVSYRLAPRLFRIESLSHCMAQDVKTVQCRACVASHRRYDTTRKCTSEPATQCCDCFALSSRCCNAAPRSFHGCDMVVIHCEFSLVVTIVAIDWYRGNYQRGYNY